MKSSTNTVVNGPDSWRTASLGGTVDTTPLDLSVLGDHLELCRSTQGHVFALHCVAQTMQGFVASRFVTTLLCIALLVSVAIQVL